MTMSVDARVANSAVVRTKCVVCAASYSLRWREMLVVNRNGLGVLAKRIDSPTSTINSAPSSSVAGKPGKTCDVREVIRLIYLMEILKDLSVSVFQKN